MCKTQVKMNPLLSLQALTQFPNMGSYMFKDINLNIKLLLLEILSQSAPRFFSFNTECN